MVDIPLRKNPHSGKKKRKRRTRENESVERKEKGKEESVILGKKLNF